MFVARDVEVANHLMESLLVRRKKVELQAKEVSIVDSCIKITCDSISIRTPTLRIHSKKEKERKIGRSGVDIMLTITLGKINNLTSMVLKPQNSKC